MKIESSVIFFPCRDILETKGYYADVLHFPIHKDLGSTVWFDCGYGYIGFVQYDDGREMASGVCISFNLESIEAVDAMYDALCKRPVIGMKGAPVHHARFPVYSFFLSDPNGYLLEFQKTTD